MCEVGEGGRKCEDGMKAAGEEGRERSGEGKGECGRKTGGEEYKPARPMGGVDERVTDDVSRISVCWMNVAWMNVFWNNLFWMHVSDASFLDGCFSHD